MNPFFPYRQQLRINQTELQYTAGSRHYAEAYFPEYGFFVTDYQGEVTLFEASRGELVKWTPDTVLQYLASTRGKSTPHYYPDLGWYLYSQDAAEDGLPYHAMGLRPKEQPPLRKLDNIAFTDAAGEHVVYDEQNEVWYGNGEGGILVPEPLDIHMVATMIVQVWKERQMTRPFTREEIKQLDPIQLLKECLNGSNSTLDVPES